MKKSSKNITMLMGVVLLFLVTPLFNGCMAMHGIGGMGHQSRNGTHKEGKKVEQEIEKGPHEITVRLESQQENNKPLILRTVQEVNQDNSHEAKPHRKITPWIVLGVIGMAGGMAAMMALAL